MANKIRRKGKRVYKVDKFVCKFIREEFFAAFDQDKPKLIGDKFGIHYHTVEKILDNKDGYHIPLHTLNTICFYKGIKLSKFFQRVEELYGKNLDDTYVIKSSQKNHDQESE